MQTSDAQRAQKEQDAKVRAKVLKGVADMTAMVANKAATDGLKTFPAYSSWGDKTVAQEDQSYIGLDDYRTQVSVHFRAQYYSYSNPPRTTGTVEVVVKWDQWITGLPRQTRKYEVRLNEEFDIAKYYEVALKLVRRSLDPINRADRDAAARDKKDALTEKYKARDFPEHPPGLWVHFEEEKDGEPRWKVSLDDLHGLTTARVRELTNLMMEFKKHQ